VVANERRPHRVELAAVEQEFLAQMLGTRRSSVTVAAGMLQKAGLIGHSRGDVKIIDGPLLEEAARECR
jgi:Crp-like helix-turn-helix domain